MGFTAEELAQLGEFIDHKIDGKLDVAVAEATAPKPSVNDEVQNRPENQPDFYVHLADGSTMVSKDSASTHMTNAAGEQIVVTGRYPVGPGATVATTPAEEA
jgi:hypothetical protein